MSTVTSTTQVVGSEMQLAPDYKYVNAKGGQIGVSTAQAVDGQEFVVIHAAAHQFHPDVTEGGAGTKLVRCALATLELDMESARTLHALLGQMLTPLRKK